MPNENVFFIKLLQFEKIKTQSAKMTPNQLDMRLEFSLQWL